MVDIRRLLNDAVKNFDNHSFMSTSEDIDTAKNAVAGDYYLLLDDLSELIRNMSNNQKAVEKAREINEISRRLLGSDCVPISEEGTYNIKTWYNNIKACMVKLRDWANKNIDVDGICVYDKRAPKSLIDMCKLTSKKIMRFGERAIEDVSVFAGVNAVYVVHQEHPNAWVTADDTKRVIINKPAFGDTITKYNTYAKDAGINTRCNGINNDKYTACRVDNETQASALMSLVHIYDIKDEFDELDDYVYNILIENEEEHVKHNIESAKKYEKYL